MYDRTLEQELIHASEEWTRVSYVDSNAYGESVRYWLEYEGRDWGDDNPDKVL